MTKIELTAEERQEARDLHAKGRPVDDIAEWLGCTPEQVRYVTNPTKRRARTSGGLRDVLFDEIERLQRGDAQPHQSMAVASLAKQIISVAKAEFEFSRALGEEKPQVLGTLQLGERDDGEDAEAPALGPPPERAA